MAVVTFPSGSNNSPPSLTADQVANLASDIATQLSSIERLAVALSDCGDMKTRGALGQGIEALARSAGAMADLLVSGHAGVPVRGDFNAWCMPAFHPLPARQ